MNKVESALHELSNMDELSSRDSLAHSLTPLTKLLCTIAYIIIVVSFDKYELTRLFPLILWPIIVYQMSDLSVSTCFYKLRIVLPLVLAVGVFNPFFDKTPLLHIGSVAVSGGVISMITLLLKGVYCLMASFWLVATTQIDSLCAGLRKLHFPSMIVTLLLLTYRYVGVMTEELAIMTEAYQLRAPGQKGIHISAWGSFLGQLLLRSMDRAQELYSSMMLRGYHSHFHYAQYPKVHVKDFIFCICSFSFFLLIKFIDVAQIIGAMFTR